MNHRNFSIKTIVCYSQSILSSFIPFSMIDTSLGLAAIIGPLYMILGLSVLMYPKVWTKLMQSFEKDHLQLFTLMLITMVIGLILIRLHNIWEWSPYVLITVVGWGAFLKGAFYFLAPGSWVKSVLRLSTMQWMMVLGGIVALLAGGLLTYWAYLI